MARNWHYDEQGNAVLDNGDIIAGYVVTLDDDRNHVLYHDTTACGRVVDPAMLPPADEAIAPGSTNCANCQEALEDNGGNLVWPPIPEA